MRPTRHSHGQQSAAEAWLGIDFLERACRQQVMALSAGRAAVLLASDAAQQTSHEQAIKTVSTLRRASVARLVAPTRSALAGL